jgi:hypothetical protein
MALEIGTLHLEVESDNEEASRLYRTVGFEATGRTLMRIRLKERHETSPLVITSSEESRKVSGRPAACAGTAVCGFFADRSNFFAIGLYTCTSCVLTGFCKSGNDDPLRHAT